MIVIQLTVGKFIGIVVVVRGVVVVLTKLLQLLCNCCHHTFNFCYCPLEIYGILQLLRFFRGVPHSIDFDHYIKCGDCVCGVETIKD